MYRRITGSYHALEDKGGITQEEIRFPDWDGNNEGEYRRFARNWCMEGGEQGKYLELGSAVFSNSHSETLQTYRGMLATYGELSPGPRRNLTAEEIKSLLGLDQRTSFRDGADL